MSDGGEGGDDLGGDTEMAQALHQPKPGTRNKVSGVPTVVDGHHRVRGAMKNDDGAADGPRVEAVPARVVRKAIVDRDGIGGPTPDRSARSGW